MDKRSDVLRRLTLTTPKMQHRVLASHSPFHLVFISLTLCTLTVSWASFYSIAQLDDLTDWHHDNGFKSLLPLKTKQYTINHNSVDIGYKRVSQQTDKNLWTSSIDALSSISICYFRVFTNHRSSAVARFGIKVEKRLRTAQAHFVKYCQANKGARIRSMSVQNGQSWTTKRGWKVTQRASLLAGGVNCHSLALARIRLLSSKFWTKR